MDEMLSCEELTLKVNSLEKEVKFNNFFLKKMFDIMPSQCFIKTKMEFMNIVMILFLD